VKVRQVVQREEGKREEVKRKGDVLLRVLGDRRVPLERKSNGVKSDRNYTEEGQRKRGERKKKGKKEVKKEEGSKEEKDELSCFLKRFMTRQVATREPYMN
jgi:hypothetical protein